MTLDSGCPAGADGHQELDALHATIVDLLIEEQELLHIVKPNLLALQLIALGAVELRHLEEETRVRRLRSKLSQITAALESGRAVDLGEIDHKLDLEFAATMQRIRTLATQVREAGRNLATPMSDGDEAVFKQAHRALVERLHPVLHRASEAGRDDLWRRVCEAYGKHSVLELRKLEALCAGRRAEAPQDPERLRHLVGEHLCAIAALRQTHPFVLERWLADETWLAGRRSELEDETALLAARADAIEAGLARRLPSLGRIQGFGPN